MLRKRLAAPVVALAAVAGLTAAASVNMPGDAVGAEIHTVRAHSERAWSVFMQTKTSNGATTWCSGALVGDRTVLTAAHCLRGQDGGLTPDSIEAWVGRYIDRDGRDRWFFHCWASTWYAAHFSDDERWKDWALFDLRGCTVPGSDRPVVPGRAIGHYRVSAARYDDMGDHVSGYIRGYPIRDREGRVRFVGHAATTAHWVAPKCRYDAPLFDFKDEMGDGISGSPFAAVVANGEPRAVVGIVSRDCDGLGRHFTGIRAIGSDLAASINAAASGDYPPLANGMGGTFPLSPSLSAAPKGLTCAFTRRALRNPVQPGSERCLRR